MISSNTVNPSAIYAFQPEAQFAAKERAELLRKALLRISERDFMVLNMRAEGFTLDQIGLAINCSCEWVRKIEIHGQDALRAALADLGVTSFAEFM